MTPLIDLAGSYQGEPGGLYPGGTNQRPGAHQATGMELAAAIGPLNAAGAADPSGRYVLISIGMSNTTQEFSVFKDLADQDPLKDPRLTIVDGAQGGMTAQRWSDPACPCWATLDDRLRAAGVAAAQVTVAWIKLANSQPTEGWPAHAQRLAAQTLETLGLLASRFPNLVLAYLSSRIYAGYATTALNPEPYAYESAFAVRWVIEDQLRGGPGFRAPTLSKPARVPSGYVGPRPWLSWGPYLWADGMNPRSDGLTWACSDLQASDGTHPSATGRRKVAELLHAFVREDSTARQWYLTYP
ncbi:MAG: hypothetical protein ACE148_03300 [Vicinamibacterales bacterium]